jgi:16S rRNA (guanine(1405)-N(7))-methyltransferase
MKSNSSSVYEPINEVIARVIESPKYSSISQTLIRRIAILELEKRKKIRETVKAVKNKLHQVGGSYLDRAVDYKSCKTILQTAYRQGNEDFRQACKQVMCYHSSSRERLPDLDRFYLEILADIPAVKRVIDIACGFHPLAIPWMDLPTAVEYIAVDIYYDMIDFINWYLTLIGVRGSAYVSDVINTHPSEEADVAFVLKTIPCLEQVEKTIGIKLLDGIQAKYIIVSFPKQSLGGRRDKGMQENYANRFYEIIANRTWTVKTYGFTNEMVYVVRK